jgi:exopolyphosphatase/guanosine-5'-triphosphate,3'-diphosphate pyrophosphatase
MKEYDTDKIHGARMTLAEYQELVYELGEMSLRERRRALAFEPKRADVITAGGLLSFALAERTGLKSVRISDRSLRFGMLYHLAGHKVEFA